MDRLYIYWCKFRQCQSYKLILKPIVLNYYETLWNTAKLDVLSYYRMTDLEFKGISWDETINLQRLYNKFVAALSCQLVQLHLMRINEGNSWPGSVQRAQNLILRLNNVLVMSLSQSCVTEWHQWPIIFLIWSDYSPECWNMTLKRLNSNKNKSTTKTFQWHAKYWWGNSYNRVIF